MRIEVKVPQLPESVTEATLVSWHRKVGESVARDENLVDVETDKVVLELPAPAAGVLVEVVKGDGSTVAGQEVISFRVASNSRRRTADGDWEAGQTLYITVNCWGKLVTGVGAGLYKGAPIIAVGTVHTSEYEDRDGVKRSSLEMRASAVGPDLPARALQ